MWPASTQPTAGHAHAWRLPTCPLACERAVRVQPARLVPAPHVPLAAAPPPPLLQPLRVLIVLLPQPHAVPAARTGEASEQLLEMAGTACMPRQGAMCGASTMHAHWALQQQSTLAWAEVQCPTCARGPPRLRASGRAGSRAPPRRSARTATRGSRPSQGVGAGLQGACTCTSAARRAGRRCCSTGAPLLHPRTYGVHFTLAERLVGPGPAVLLCPAQCGQQPRREGARVYGLRGCLGRLGRCLLLRRGCCGSGRRLQDVRGRDGARVELGDTLQGGGGQVAYSRPRGGRCSCFDRCMHGGAALLVEAAGMQAHTRTPALPTSRGGGGGESGVGCARSGGGAWLKAGGAIPMCGWAA